MQDLDALIDHIDQPHIDSNPELEITRLFPDVDQDTALAVQIGVKRRKAAGGDCIVGHQASFTSAGIRVMFPDSPAPMVGTLLASLMRNSGDTVTLDAQSVFIESEIGVVLKRDLEGPMLTHAEVLGAIEGFVPVIEVAPLHEAVKQRQFSWPHMIAVQKALGGFIVVGGKMTSPKGFDPRLEGCVIHMGGEARAGATGFEAMGSPLIVLAAIARKLYAVGEKLRAGQIVITGSLPAPQVVRPTDRDAQLEFQTLGRVSVSFSR